ncbi:MAG: phage tail tape measure protein [Patescibacteria group bacterium]|nr:phage tail tape measure protein [Patescibacteria group bacterium]
MASSVLFHIKGNSSSFSRAVTQASTGSSKLKTSLGKTSTSARSFGASLQHMSGSLVSTAAKIATLQTNMLGLQGAFKITSTLKNTVVSFASFEEGMIKLEAVTSMASKEMLAMKTLINDLAIETKFTSKEVSEAAYSLATLGVKGTEAFEQMLPVVTKTAIAMDRGAGETAEVLLKTMKQFKIEMKDAGSVADVLVNAYTNSSLNLEKFATAMQYAGPSANLLGESLEDTVALLALLSDRGIEASSAGTQMRAALTDLATESRANNKILEKYGLTIADVDPTNRKFIDVLKTLEEAGVSSGDMFSLLGKRAGPVVQMLIDLGDENETSTEKMRKMSSQMNKSGTAARIAEKMQKGLGFAFEQTSASMGLFSIAVGESLAKVFNLKDLAHKTTDVFAALTRVVSNIDFNSLKTQGIKIFDPDALISNFHTIFIKVLPALTELFKVSAGIGVSFLLEKLTVSLPLVIKKGFSLVPIVFSAFIYVASEGAKLFVSIIVDGFNLVMSSFGVWMNHYLGDMMVMVGDMANFMHLHTTASEYWKEGKARQSITAKDLTGFADTDVIKESAQGLIDAVGESSKEGITFLSEKAAEASIPSLSGVSEHYKKQREELMESFSPAIQNFTEAVKQVPTSGQKEAFEEIKGMVVNAQKEKKPKETFEEITERIKATQEKAFEGTKKRIMAEQEETYTSRESSQNIQVTDNRVQHLYRQENRSKQLIKQTSINPRGDKDGD